MIQFKFDLNSQTYRYNAVKDKIKNKDFYQKLNFYVLPFMPEKFRNRVIFLPEKVEPEKVYKKYRSKIRYLENKWNIVNKEFIKKLTIYFPKVNSMNIVISPQLYGSLGSVEENGNPIYIFPRFDRSIVGIQKLIINALVRHSNQSKSWEENQLIISSIQHAFFPNSKSMLNILDTEFAGKLAEESAKYLEKLRASSKFEVDKPENLTRSERGVMNLLLRNKNKLVTFDQIAEEIWREKAYEKYSEYAITTIIKKIKKKLKQKTDKHIIQAQRGVGYILHT